MTTNNTIDQMSFADDTEGSEYRPSSPPSGVHSDGDDVHSESDKISQEEVKYLVEDQNHLFDDDNDHDHDRDSNQEEENETKETENPFQTWKRDIPETADRNDKQASPTASSTEEEDEEEKQKETDESDYTEEDKETNENSDDSNTFNLDHLLYVLVPEVLAAIVTCIKLYKEPAAIHMLRQFVQLREVRILRALVFVYLYLWMVTKMLYQTHELWTAAFLGRDVHCIRST